MFTLLALLLCVYLLYDTFAKARQYYLENVTSPRWRGQVRITYNEKEKEAIRLQPFLTVVFPHYIHLTIVLVGIVVSAIFIGHGIIFIGTFSYAVVVFVILPAFKRKSQ